MKAGRLFLLASLLVSLTDCVRVQSNSKADAVPPFSRILVVTNMQDVDNQYAMKYVGAFPAGYEVCAMVLNPLSFGDPDSLTRQQAKECNSEVMLTITLTKKGTYGRYNNSPYEFFAEMRSVSTNQPFWKALISASTLVGEQLPPSRIVKQLEEDGIINRNRSAVATRY